MPKLPPFGSSRDKTPKYTVKEVAEMMELSTYTVRYYENAGLVPEVDRSEGNIRLFSDYSLGWLRLVTACARPDCPLRGSGAISSFAQKAMPRFRNVRRLFLRRKRACGSS